MNNSPLAYFITFTTYGTWLHGDERGSILRKDNHTRLIAECTPLRRHETGMLKSKPVILSRGDRNAVISTIIKHCQIRKWKLYAAHVRTNHVHIIVKSNVSINDTASQFKQWSTRILKESGFESLPVWTKGSSRKYIFTEDKLREKVHYVAYEQGKMLEHYIHPQFRKS